MLASGARPPFSSADFYVRNDYRYPMFFDMGASPPSPIEYEGNFSAVLPGGTLLHKGFYDLLAMIPTPSSASRLWSAPIVKDSIAGPRYENIPAPSSKDVTALPPAPVAPTQRLKKARKLTKEMVSSPTGFVHLVHASDVAQAEALLRRWGPDGMGKLGDPKWAQPIKEVVRGQVQARAIAEVVNAMRPSVLNVGAPRPQLRVVNGISSLTATTVSAPTVPDKDSILRVNAVDGLPVTVETIEARVDNTALGQDDGEDRAPTIRARKAKPIVPSLVTLEKAVSARIYFENLYFPLLRRPPPRDQRRLAMEKEMEGLRLTEGDKQALRNKWKQNETDYLRERRRKVDVSSFVQLKTIGHGAFGVVSLVKERSSGQLFAMKQLKKTDMLRKGQEGHVRAEREVLKSAALAGWRSGAEWIVRLFYSFQDRDSLYLVLEYMGGGDLLNLLIERDVFEESFAKFYVAEMVLAIEQCHKQGFIHRDIKPDNFLFDNDGHIKLSDFGLATDLHWAHETSYYEQQRQDLMKKYGIDLADGNDFKDGVATRRMDPKQVELLMGGDGKDGIFTWRERNRKKLAYSICGTNSYMSPEVIRGQGYHYSCDYWSLGVIMFECLYGFPPFISNSRHVTRQKILNWRQSLRFPVRPRVSREGVDLIQKLLCEAEDRLGSWKVAGGSRPPSLAGYNRRSGFVSHLAPPSLDGAEQIKAHPWFRGIDWANIRFVPAPFRPDLSNPEDTRHFDPDIEPEPLAPANGALPDATRDPLLRDRTHGAAVLDARKAYAFAGFTHRSPKILDYRALRLTAADGKQDGNCDRGRAPVRGGSELGRSRAMSM